VKKAMTYPIAVLVVAFVVTGILLIKVVPMFEEMFLSFGADLPAFTRMVVDLSEWMQAYWYYILAGLIAVTFTFKEAKQRSKAFREKMDQIMLKVPVVGDIIYKSSVARFGRVLSTT